MPTKNPLTESQCKKDIEKWTVQSVEEEVLRSFINQKVLQLHNKMSCTENVT